MVDQSPARRARKKVAGGRSEAQTPGMADMNLHPERVPEEFCDPFRVEKWMRDVPGGYASIRPPATFCQPFRLKSVLAEEPNAYLIPADEAVLSSSRPWFR